MDITTTTTTTAQSSWLETKNPLQTTPKSCLESPGPSLDERADLAHVPSSSSSTDGCPMSPGRTEASTPLTECDVEELGSSLLIGKTTLSDRLFELYAENITAKGLRTAHAALPAIPHEFPEIVPCDIDSDGSYELRTSDFWTCGFFPGTLYAIQERLIKYPQSVHLSSSVSLGALRHEVETLCHAWIAPIRDMDTRIDTHDLGFIIMPALRADWELSGNSNSLRSIECAARSLATRYVPTANAIRSWDLLRKKDIEILDQDSNMIVIIDSMCNLDLLYYASHHAQDPSLAAIATKHAETVLRTHLRPEELTRPWGAGKSTAYQGQWYSTCHVANVDPKTGDLKFRMTAQGYQNESTWSRGQAWAILGYAETYMWTKDRKFLEAACGTAEYFLHRLHTAPQIIAEGRLTPVWDFDAPIEGGIPLRDSSAGMIASNGLLIMSQALASIGRAELSARYREAALAIVEDTLSFALAPERAHIVLDEENRVVAKEVAPNLRFDGMLKFGTANNNVNARKRYANHALVYGDYYLAEFGNKLLRMGLV